MRLVVRLQELADAIRGSYWFLPALMALVAVLASNGLVLLDGHLGDAWLGRYEWITGSRPDGARSVLSTIASSTITVAGVVFSITLAAVTFASGQYGPRLLTYFQRDRGSQASLGVFIATYLYCLMVLRTIRSAEEASAEAGGALREAFVPHLALYGAFLLAIASIGVLIYFVHHVTDSIHINSVIARIGGGLIDDVRAMSDAPESAPYALPPFPDAATIEAPKTGYVKAIDEVTLAGIGSRHDAVIRLLRRPGDFVHRGWALVQVSPESSVDEECREEIHAAFAFGRQRTALQDLRFAGDELVEIAARALSSGINDPYTAIAAIEWLGAALSELERRPDEPAAWRDEEGRVRVVAEPFRFDDYVRSAFGQLRPYLADDPNARARAMKLLEEVASNARSERHRAALRHEVEQLARLASS